MRIDNLINFFNTLFGIEITIFGIISAVIFVFIQLVFSKYSYKHIGHILKNYWINLYFIFSIIDLLITSAGSYFLTLGHHDLFPKIYFATNIIITNQYYALACLLLIFISIALFVILVIKNISYLQTHRAIFLLSEKTSFKEIRDFLLKKYKLEVPYQIKFGSIGASLGIYITKPNESKKAIKARIKKEQIENKLECKRIEAEIEKISKKIKQAEDPLLPVRDMMIQFIRRSDLSSLEESSNLLIEITKNFISKLPKNSEKWAPENDLALKYTKHLIELLETLLEISDRESLESAKRIILESSFKIVQELVNGNYFNEINQFEELWQQVADNSIGKSSILFQNIIKYYGQIGEKLFLALNKKDNQTKPSEIEKVIEDLFRYIGWLGERLLIKLPFEESPLFINDEYSTEFDTYYNCLMSFSDMYNRNHQDLYPLIYFDALIVVMKRLVKIYSKDNNSELNNNIFFIAFSFSQFAENAILAGNGDGAALATLRIKETYSELKTNGLDRDANDVIKLLVKIGMLAAINKDKFKKVANFMSKPIDQYIIDELALSGEDIDSEVLECHIKVAGDHDSRWGFITNLGAKMNRNFGLMFDPATGELYGENDPRRR